MADNADRPREGERAKRVAFNPVELALLCAFSFIFVNSVLGLVNGSGLRTASSPGQPEKTTNQEEGRSPAAMKRGFTTLELNCDRPLVQDLSAEKIRLTGPLCGSDTYNDHTRTEIVNLNNSVKGTAFNHPNQTFLTDYIPLEPGENQIQVKFVYQSGKTVAQTLKLTRGN